VLMGIGARDAIGARLTANGWRSSTPAAIVLGAGTHDMFTWRGSISELHTALMPPSSAAGTIVIGDVAALPIDLMNGIPLSQEITR